MQVRPVWCVGTRLCVGMENELCLSYATHFVVIFLSLVAIAMKCPTPHWTPRPHQARDTNGHNCPSSLPHAHTTVDVHGENKWPAPDKPCLFVCTSANLCWCCRVTAYCLLCMVCGVTGIAQYAWLIASSHRSSVFEQLCWNGLIITWHQLYTKPIFT